MDKVHFDDLTEINVPFGLLDDDTQKRLMACEKVQYFFNEWVGKIRSDFNRKSDFSLWITYRQAPEPEPNKIRYMAVYDTWHGKKWPLFEDAKAASEYRGGYIIRLEETPDGKPVSVSIATEGGDA